MRNVYSWDQLKKALAPESLAIVGVSPLTAKPDSRALVPSRHTGCSPIRTRQLLDAATHDTLTERESKAILACYGIPVVGERLVVSEKDAITAATEMGYPVAIKVESPDIPHKTEADAIRLSIKDDEALRQGFSDVMANALRWNSAARINGALVQPMISKGLELMVGVRVDPQFGPLLIVGFGGVMAELMKDVVISLLPVSASQLRAMLPRLRGSMALQGFRGAPPVNVELLVDILLRVAEFAVDQGARLAEMDLNPLICTSRGIVAVDALIVKSRAG